MKGSFWELFHLRARLWESCGQTSALQQLHSHQGGIPAEVLGNIDLAVVRGNA